MKRIITLLLIATILPTTLLAQSDTTGDENKDVIYINSQKSGSISNDNGRVRITLNGMCFDFGGKNTKQSNVTLTTSNYTSKQKKAYYGFAGLGAPSFNHFALIEIGACTTTGLDYSLYSPEEANALVFSNRKSVNVGINLGTINVPLNKSRSLVLSAAYGFMCENYTMAGNYTMEFRDGMMRPVALEGKIKKSKLSASYFHVPITLDWNIKGSSFFISAGVTLDVLMSSHLKYKFPKTSIDGEVTLNPIQVGATARIGWKRLYAFANYSFLDMFKAGTGPKANRLSAGMGFWF